jgi:hypothetical protein
MHKRKVFSEVHKRILACRQNYMCTGDGCKSLQFLPCTWELDHIKPLFLQGTNDSENLQIICPNCHALKTQAELMAAAETRRETKLQLTKQRIYKRKKARRKRKQIDAEIISPYFDYKNSRFLSADSISGSVRMNIGISRLCRHLYTKKLTEHQR